MIIMKVLEMWCITKSLDYLLRLQHVVSASSLVLVACFVFHNLIIKFCEIGSCCDFGYILKPWAWVEFGSWLVWLWFSKHPLTLSFLLVALGLALEAFSFCPLSQIYLIYEYDNIHERFFGMHDVMGTMSRRFGIGNEFSNMHTIFCNIGICQVLCTSHTS